MVKSRKPDFKFVPKRVKSLCFRRDGTAACFSKKEKPHVGQKWAIRGRDQINLCDIVPADGLFWTGGMAAGKFGFCHSHLLGPAGSGFPYLFGALFGKDKPDPDQDDAGRNGPRCCLANPFLSDFLRQALRKLLESGHDFCQTLRCRERLDGLVSSFFCLQKADPPLGRSQAREYSRQYLQISFHRPRNNFWVPGIP